MHFELVPHPNLCVQNSLILSLERRASTFTIRHRIVNPAQSGRAQSSNI